MQATAMNGKKKKKYVSPSIEVIKVNVEQNFLDLSIPLGHGSGSGGGGQAKKGTFFDDEEGFTDDKVGYPDKDTDWDKWMD